MCLKMKSDLKQTLWRDANIKKIHQNFMFHNVQYNTRNNCKNDDRIPLQLFSTTLAFVISHKLKMITKPFLALCIVIVIFYIKLVK